jgi:transcriptional regulator GlxA family with amidase domain
VFAALALKTVPARTRRLASVCTGTFILAQAGLLSGRRATTHWRRTGCLARAFLDVSVEPMPSLSATATCFTSARLSSGTDLALALVEMDYDPELVHEVARVSGVPQTRWRAIAILCPSRRRATAGFGVKCGPDAIAADPGADHSVMKLAFRASLSTRQLTRLFQSELGTTPARYVELVRIDLARGALEAGRPWR